MFTLFKEDKNARAGILKTSHGEIETPFFMPVATKAVGRFVSVDDYKQANAKAIIHSFDTGDLIILASLIYLPHQLIIFQEEDGMGGVRIHV